jgi:hypothetical protein
MVRPFSSTCEIAARVGGEGDLLDPYTRPAVLLLHNLDTTWPSGDIAAARQDVVAIEEALVETGHVVVEVVAVQDPDLIGCLRGYRPANHIVFNGCEELPGVPRSEGQVVQVLEARGFTYTGGRPGPQLGQGRDAPLTGAARAAGAALAHLSNSTARRLGLLPGDRQAGL